MFKDVSNKSKIGVFAGMVGAIGLFPAFLLIDTQIGVPPGTFYHMIGLTMGLDGFGAITFGLSMHLLTAALIGVVFCNCSTLHTILNINSVQKGIFAGGITGIQVYAIFFLPISLFVMMPTISDYAGGLNVTTAENSALAMILIENFQLILWGSLVFHVIFGSIMGLFAGITMYEEYKIKKKEDSILKKPSMPKPNRDLRKNMEKYEKKHESDT